MKECTDESTQRSHHWGKGSVPSPRRVLQCAVAGVVIAVAAWGEAFAQSPQGAQSGLDLGALPEVVVTAQKREQDIHDVPQSVTAIDAGEIVNRHVTSIEDLAGVIPGLAISQSGGPGENFPIIRGISSFSGASTVGIYINDTPVAIPFIINTSVGEPDLRLFDLSRVEVLKGPQGTLYGASSLGGTLKYVTEQP